MTELHFDVFRWNDKEAFIETGIIARALSPDGHWENDDIVFLDKESLLAFLRNRGEQNKFSEDVVGILLGYGRLNDQKG